VSATCSPGGADLLAWRTGAAVCGSVDELAGRADVDVVVASAAGGVIAGARAGKHVFCEMPIALSEAEAGAVLAAVHAAGVLFLAGNVLHFADGIEGARAAVHGGAVGDLVYARAVRTGPGSSRPGWERAGPAVHRHIHELDLVLSLMGAPDRVTLAGSPEDDLLLALLEFGGGRCATLELGATLRWPQHHLLLHGTEGAVRVDLQHAAVEDEVGALWLRALLAEEMAYLHALVGGAPPTPDLAHLTDGDATLRTIRTADALTRSFAEDRKVTLGEA